MVTGLFLSGTLLKWAVDNKLNNRFSVEGSNVTVQMRERQLGCLAKNIYHEAGHEPFEGKVAVAQVTMNRSESGKFPDDICRVIFQKNIIYEKIICEFSWVCDREISFKPVNKVAYDESMEVAKKVLLEGFRLPSLKEAMFFHGDYIKPGWNRTRIAQIGHHIFYK
jgi:spore germination cell wall hydrolase CwlJ-like protein